VMTVGPAALPELLAAWLPGQRWYSGKDERPDGLTITTDTTLLADDPELRHLILSVGRGDQAARYQLLLGLRAEVPEALRHAVIGQLPDGRTACCIMRTISSSGSTPCISGCAGTGAISDRWSAGPVPSRIANGGNFHARFGRHWILA